MGGASRKRIVLTALAAALAIAGVFAVHGWLTTRRAEKEARQAAEARAAERRAFLAQFGIVSDGYEDFVALPPGLPHGQLQAALGQAMFRERRLARTPRRTCAACHLLNEGGTDGRVHGEVITRPAMNAVFASVFMHDGSVTNLQNLVRRMVEDPDFSGAESLEKAAVRLSADENLVARFRVAYPDDGLTASNVVDSVVQYCRTLVTSGTPFDFYCGGRTNALDALQQRGMALFRERKCLSCHDGPALGTLQVSEGRKVPSLRGVSRRRAFLSKGSCTDLISVLSYMPGGDLEAPERAALVSFLKAL